MKKGKTDEKSTQLKEYCTHECENQAAKRQQQKRLLSHHNRGLPKLNVKQKVGTWKGGGVTDKAALLFGKCYLVQNGRTEELWEQTHTKWAM